MPILNKPFFMFSCLITKENEDTYNFTFKIRDSNPINPYRHQYFEVNYKHIRIESIFDTINGKLVECTDRGQIIYPLLCFDPKLPWKIKNQLQNLFINDDGKQGIQKPMIHRTPYQFEFEKFIIKNWGELPSSRYNELKLNCKKCMESLEELKKHDHDAKIVDAASKLYEKLEHAAKIYFKHPNEKKSYDLFLEKTREAIDEAAPVLNQYPNMKEILGNILLAVLGLGVLYGIAVAINGGFFFKPASRELLKQINKLSSDFASLYPEKEANEIPAP